MLFIIIGNILSGVAAIFTGISSWTRKVDKIYLYQTFQCSILAVASIFFGSYTGIATLVICAIRNFLAYKKKLTIHITVIMMVILVLLSIFVNNRGAVGWIVTIATLIYTIGVLIFRTELKIKLNNFLNLILWIIYDAFIWDFSSLIMDAIILIIAAIAIIRILLEKHTEKAKKAQK